MPFPSTKEGALLYDWFAYTDMEMTIQNYVYFNQNFIINSITAYIIYRLAKANYQSKLINLCTFTFFLYRFSDIPTFWLFYNRFYVQEIKLVVFFTLYILAYLYYKLK